MSLFNYTCILNEQTVQMMNSTKVDGINGEILNNWSVIMTNTPRIWLFGDTIDGMWILLPIAAFGTVVNSFQVTFHKIAP